jgi:hypothetical protein
MCARVVNAAIEKYRKLGGSGWSASQSRRVSSRRLSTTFLSNDLKYGREVTPERAAEFADPDDVIYVFRKSIGQFFEDAL